MAALASSRGRLWTRVARLMAVSAAAAICSAAFCSAAVVAGTVATEWSVVGGASTDGSRSAAGVLKVYGSPTRDLQFYLEGVSEESSSSSDSFSAAYPYGGGLEARETYAETDLRPGHYQVSLRAGRYRPPFGIYSESDQGYVGFLRSPLIRYEDNWALSNDWLETGTDLSFGTPALQFETSLSTPGDGSYRRRSGLDSVSRLQWYHGDGIVGLSHISTRLAAEYGWAHGMTEFNGIDFRWMRGGTQLRGEWLEGQPFDGAHTTGWYLDAIAHWSSLERVTWVARIEGLRYEAPVSPLDTRRLTLGSRIELSGPLSLQINDIYQEHLGALSNQAVDIGFRYTVRR